MRDNMRHSPTLGYVISVGDGETSTRFLSLLGWLFFLDNLHVFLQHNSEELMLLLAKKNAGLFSAQINLRREVENKN